MTTPAARDDQSPLELALFDVHATLIDLLVAADEQHAAVVARDSERLESVTRQQERLSARLAHAEGRRLKLTGSAPIAAALASVPRDQVGQAEQLSTSIASAVRDLKHKQSQTASLLQQSIELTNQTLGFIQRLVAPPTPSYGPPTHGMNRQSLLVDSRA